LQIGGTVVELVNEIVTAAAPIRQQHRPMMGRKAAAVEFFYSYRVFAPDVSSGGRYSIVPTTFF
jgi:hypothetical protein